MAAALGVSAAWAAPVSRNSHNGWRERRDLYPQGVASGDPDAYSVLLWTRRPFPRGSRERLRVEVSEDEAFDRVVVAASTNLLAAADWTCRILVGNLKPARFYWYRFIDADGNASRVGRTRTAPADDDGRPVRFAFCSCQDLNTGSLNAYRRMIFEDERAPERDQLEFVLHLGDFIYETLLYPEDYPQGISGRPLRDVARYPHGEKITAASSARGIFHIPATLEDYREIYRGYLRDPDLQDARARWPFVCVWDNHEFSSQGWQSLQSFNGETRPRQTRKVFANQVWFEYQPARVVKSGGPSLEAFNPPAVKDSLVPGFDGQGLADEPNNLAAIDSLTVYRALRWGRHLDLMVTDQRSYRSQTPTSRKEAAAFTSGDFPWMFPQEALEILDAGRAYAGGNAPEAIRFGEHSLANFRRGEPPQTILGTRQKSWFLDRLKNSPATWKIWGNPQATLDLRMDPQNLPAGFTRRWPGAGYAGIAVGDHSTAYVERAEIYAQVREAGVTGFVTVSGDRHAFWAGLAASALPPQPFEPIGVAFVTGSLSSAGFVEHLEQTLPQDHPLCSLYGAQRPPQAPPQATMNVLFRHGVRSALAYAESGDIGKARRLSNPDLSPHLSFVDMNGHGYSTVRVSSDALECEFVCIPRPIERAARPDGGPLSYRVVHQVPLWRPGQRPQLKQRILDGRPELLL